TGNTENTPNNGTQVKPNNNPAVTGTPNANEEQTGQPNATVTPGQGNDEINGATKPGEVSPKPEENNPAVTEPGTTA
ncbi:hypothetical protein VUS13_32825, partial [Pseudomonas aeruginosa]